MLTLLFAITLPAAEIRGPSTAAVGDLVILEAIVDQPAGAAWIVLPERTILPVENGRKVVFASGQKGTFVFVLATATDGIAEIVKHDLVVGGDPTPPQPTPPGPGPGPIPPGPGPNPPPVPPTPPAPLSPLGQFVAERVKMVDVDKATRTADAFKMAEVFDSVAREIEGGRYPSSAAGIKKAIGETADRNGTVVGVRKTAWQAGLFGPLQEKLTAMYKGGEIGSMAALAKAWRDVAAGLRAGG